MTTWNNLSPIEAAKTQKSLEAQNKLNAMVGAPGAVKLKLGETVSCTGHFYAIFNVKGVAIDLTTGGATVSDPKTMENFDTSNMVLPDGATIYGNWTKVTIVAGECIVYKKAR